MKMKKIVTAAMILGTISLSAGLVIAYDHPTQGPIPFTTWDKDNSGTVDEQEFNTFREERQAMVKSSGHVGRNMANAPTFAQIDTDSDGLITAEELTTRQQSMRGKRGMGRHHGTEQAMTQDQTYNTCGMGRGHKGNGPGLNGKMGQRYQAMDAESKENFDTFFAATAELRKEMMVKRAEKQAVMHSTNPDPDQAAQLTRDLLELRSQMMAQAEEAGVSIGPGTGHGYGHGGQRW